MDRFRNVFSNKRSRGGTRGAWQGEAMDSLKYRSGPTCPILLYPAGRPPLKWPYSCFRGGPLSGWVACGRLLPPWTPHAVRLWTLYEGLLEVMLTDPSLFLFFPFFSFVLRFFMPLFFLCKYYQHPSHLDQITKIEFHKESEEMKT
jgi:hypothetical protein